jgi:ribose transport system substrate-binding protein
MTQRSTSHRCNARSVRDRIRKSMGENAMSKFKHCRTALITGLAFGAAMIMAPGTSFAQERTVAFVPGNFGHPFYNLLGKGIEESAKALGWTYVTQGSTKFTAAGQTPIVNAVCGQKPDVLIVSPTDPVGMRGPIQRCIEAGIAVVLVDTTLADTSGVVTAISSDNIGGGKAAADFIGEKLGGKGTVSVQSGQANIITQAQRAKGATDQFAAKYPEIKVLELVYTQNSEATSETVTRATLTGTPDVGAFFNTAANCVGPSNAIERNGGNKPLLVCYDSSEAVTGLLKAGKVAALILQPAEQEGRAAVEAADLFLKGEKDKIQPSVVLEPIVVPAEKANDPDLQQYYYN